MTHFRTCVGCKSQKDCPTKEALKASIKGLSLTSVKHRCKDRIDMFQKGDPVIVRTYSGYSEPSDGDYGNDAIYGDYPGHFIRQNGSKALVVVKPGACRLEDCDNDFPFLPKNESGFLSIPLSRVRSDPDGKIACMTECNRCGAIAAILGGNARCEESPHWNPPCLLKQQAPRSIEEARSADEALLSSKALA